MEATCSSENSVHFQRTAWRYIPLFIATAVRTSNPTLYTAACIFLVSWTIVCVCVSTHGYFYHNFCFVLKSSIVVKYLLQKYRSLSPVHNACAVCIPSGSSVVWLACMARLAYVSHGSLAFARYLSVSDTKKITYVFLLHLSPCLCVVQQPNLWVIWYHVIFETPCNVVNKYQLLCRKGSIPAFTPWAIVDAS
jgi:hypothetical protein